LKPDGVLSGALIVYILSIGFFITPALMGGQHDIMIRDADRPRPRNRGRLAHRSTDVAHPVCW